jgi:cytoskeletal protein CcmA (bactofilin family)
MIKDNDSKIIEEKDVDTVLAEDIDFSGTMKFKNSLMIKGKGNVEAIKKLELLKGAELNGDVKTPDFIIESGCIFNGKCTMGNEPFSTKPSTEIVLEQPIKK